MGNIFDMSRKKVVILGGAGYLGSAVARAFLAEGAKVVIADVFPEWTFFLCTSYSYQND